MSGGLITHGSEKTNSSEKMDNEFLLRYFQENDIKEISLTHEGNLRIEHNSGETKIIVDEQANRQGEFQKVIDYCQKSGQTNLSQQDLLINKNNSANSLATNPKNNNALLIVSVLVGVLAVGIIIGLWLRKNKVKKS